MVFEHAHEHASQWATIRSVAEKLDCTTEALRRWVRQPAHRAFARALAKHLLEAGGGVFEILYCSSDSEVIVGLKQDGLKTCLLGFDVAAVTADYWSIVGDFAEGDWARPFAARLNDQGLFETKLDAEQYLTEYRARQEDDWDSPFEIVQVTRVRAGR